MQKLGCGNDTPAGPAGSGIMSGMRRRRGGRLHLSLARDTRRRARKAVSRSLSVSALSDLSFYIYYSVLYSSCTRQICHVDMTHCCPNASSVAATIAVHRFLFRMGDEDSCIWQRPRLTLCATARLVSAACRSAHALMASSSWGSWGRHRSALLSCRWVEGGLARAAAATAAFTVQRSDSWSSCHCSSVAAVWCSEEVAAAPVSMCALPRSCKGRESVRPRARVGAWRRWRGGDAGRRITVQYGEIKTTCNLWNSPEARVTTVTCIDFSIV